MATDSQLYFSYSAHDATLALALAVQTIDCGIPVWMDRLKVPPGDDRLIHLQESIGQCAGMVLLLSRAYFNSAYCDRERTYAQRIGLPLIPVLIAPLPQEPLAFETVCPPYRGLVERQTAQYSDRDLRDYTAFLCRQTGIQPVGEMPWEVRYLSAAIARAESRRGLTERISRVQLDKQSVDQNYIRPRPGYFVQWPQPDRFRQVAPDADRTGLKKFHTLQALLDVEPSVVLSGLPGVGKSAAVDDVLLTAAHARLHSSTAAPLPVSLRLQHWDNQRSVEDNLRANCPLPDGRDIIDRLREGDVSLLIDGLGDFGQDQTDLVARLQRWLSRVEPLTHTVVTYSLAAPAAYKALRTEWPIYLLEPLRQEQFRHYLKHVLSAERAQSLEDRVVTGTNASAAAPAVELTGSCFWLNAMILTHFHDPQMVEIGQPGRIIQKLIEQIQQDAEDIPLVSLGFGTLTGTLQRLATAMMARNQAGYMDRASAHEIVGSAEIIELAQQLHLLYIENDVVSFAHEFLWYYFIALELTDDRLATLTSRPTFADDGTLQLRGWDYAIWLYGDLSADREKTLQRMSQVNPYLALYCAATIESSLSAEIIETIVANALNDAGHGRSIPDAALTILLDQFAPVALYRPLLQSARAGSWPVREKSVQLIQRYAQPQFPGLSTALNNLDSEIREGVAAAVRLLGERAVPTLLRTLQDSSWMMRRGAAWSLGLTGDRAAVPGLVEVLKDPDPLVVREAIIALAEIGEEAALPAIMDTFSHPHWMVNRTAAKAVGLWGDGVVQPLLEKLHDPNARVRLAAVTSLSGMTDVRVPPGLIQATYDENHDVKLAALEALCDLKDVSAVKRLFSCLSDNTESPRSAQRIGDIVANLLKTMGLLDPAYNADRWTSETEAGRSQMMLQAIAKLQKNGAGQNPSAVTAKQRLQRVTRQETEAADDEQSEATDIPTGTQPGPDVTLSSAMIVELKAGLRSTNREERLTVVRKLADRDEDTARELLQEALLDTDQLVAEVAVSILETAGERALPGLLKWLNSPDRNKQAAAIDVLNRICHADSVAGLIDCLEISDTGSTTRIQGRICDLAAMALVSIRSAEALQAVEMWRKREFQTRVEDSVKHYAQQQIATAAPANDDDGVQQSTTIHTLIEALHRNQWEDQQRVAKALRDHVKHLRNTDTSLVTATLVAALNHPGWTVRWAVAEALAWVTDEQAVRALIDLLEDNSWMVRVAAIRALVEIGHPYANDGIVKTLDDDNNNVREAAAEALGEFGYLENIERLAVVAGDDDPFVRLAAVDALGKLGSHSATPLLLNALDDSSEHVRWSAARALSRVADPNIVTALAAHLGDTSAPHWEEKRVCDWLMIALERINTPEAKNALVRFGYR